MAKFNFFALGGLDEKGKSCLVIEINGEYFLFNLGVNLPHFAKLGINKIIPDTDWLKNNYKKIKAVFLANPTYENINALQYVNIWLKDIPIYTSNIGEFIVNNFFNEKSMQKVGSFCKYKVNVIEPNKEFTIGKTTFNSFRVISSVPNSLAISIKVGDAWVLIIDDYIVNSDIDFNFRNEINRIKSQLKNILLLIVNAGNVSKIKDYTSPKFDITSFLEKELSVKSRKIITLHDHDYYTFLSVLKICRKKSIPFIIGNSVFYKNYQYLTNNNYINSKGLLALPISKINELENGIIFLVNNKQKIFQDVSKFLIDKDINFEIKENDHLIFLNPIIAGFEIDEAKCVDEIAKKDISWSRLPKTYSEMKAGQEDHKYLISSLKPKYVIPSNGLYSDFVRFKRLVNNNFPKTEFIICENGQIVSFNNDEFKIEKKRLNIQEKYINNNYLSEMNESVLKERKQMSINGIILINILNEKVNEKYVTNCQIESFGLIDKNSSENEIMDEIKNTILTFSDEKLNDKNFDKKEYKNSIKKIVQKIIEKQLNKTPVILTTVI